MYKFEQRIKNVPATWFGPGPVSTEGGPDSMLLRVKENCSLHNQFCSAKTNQNVLSNERELKSSLMNVNKDYHHDSPKQRKCLYLLIKKASYRWQHHKKFELELVLLSRSYDNSRAEPFGKLIHTCTHILILLYPHL